MRPEQSSLQVAAANQNDPGARGEPRSFAEPEGPSGPPSQLSLAERSALGMLRCGLSFAQAAESTGVGVSRLLALWSQAQRR